MYSVYCVVYTVYTIQYTLIIDNNDSSTAKIGGTKFIALANSYFRAPKITFTILPSLVEAYNHTNEIDKKHWCTRVITHMD